MVDQEQLRRRALRAYEFGRLRMSVRVLLFLLPLAITCTLLSKNPAACAYLALLAAGIAVTLRWLDRRGVQAVDTGLKAGLLPLAVCIILMQLGRFPSPFLCVASCSVAAVFASAWMGYRLGRERTGILDYLLSATVALLVTALGTIDLGSGALVGLSILYITSGAIVTLIVRRRALQIH